MTSSLSLQATTVQPPPTPPTREQLRQQIQDAMAAAREAAEAQALTQGRVAQEFPPAPLMDPGIPHNVLVLVIVLGALAAATIIFGPLFRALGRRVDGRRDTNVEPAMIAPRLDRIEQAIEAMAVEVERISEGQRYVTKQMHELRALPAPNPLAQSSVAPRVGEGVGRGEPCT